MYYVEQIYTKCLAEASYYIESDGEVAIIDPIREVDQYIEKAESRGAKIKYIFETHFHADFVSGHLDLVRKTGATLVFGPQARPAYPATVANDSDFFALGRVKLKVLHTPGHTPESSCYLLVDDAGKDRAVFTGDTLFIGDVGRPDLAVSKGMTQEELAGMLYDSLREKVMQLDEDVVLYPAHGAGSQCGKSLGKETVSTIGAQKASNYALQPMSKDDFVIIVTEGLTKAPKYFSENARINMEGYAPLEEVLEKEHQPLTVSQVEKAQKEGALVLDSRMPDEFEKGFIKGALNIGLNGQFAIWAGSLIDLSLPIVLVTEEGKEKENILRLARVGFNNVTGYLQGGITSWPNEKLEQVESIQPEEVASYLRHGYTLLDIRREGETNAGAVEGSEFITLTDLEDRIEQVPEGSFLVMCAGGYRSMIASSILKSKGIDRVKNVYGGFSKVKLQDNLTIVENACKNTL